MNEWIDVAISTLLRVGVISSVSVIAIGLVMTLYQSPPDLHTLTSAGGPNTIRLVVDGVRHLRGAAVVMTGLLLLIATPIARVALSIVAFIIERDRLYTAITAAVLLILLIGFFLGLEGA